MKAIKRISKDGSTTIYRSMTDAAEDLGVTTQSISYAVNYGYHIKGYDWMYADGETVLQKRHRASTARTHLEQALDVLCPLAGRKEPDARAYIENALSGKITSDRVHRAFAKWYITQPYNDSVTIDMDEYIRRRNTLT